MACVDKQQEMEKARRIKFQTQQDKDRVGLHSLALEHKKSKIGALAVAKMRAASGGQVDSKTEMDQRDSKREAEAKGSEPEKGRESPGKSK